MANKWVNCTLGDFVTLQRGHDLPASKRTPGNTPILGSFGITGWHNEAKVKGPGVTVGRSGASYGVATYTDLDYWPLNTALFVKDFHGNDPKFAYYFLKVMDFKRYNSGSAVQSLNRNHIHPIDIEVPPLPEQKAIAHILGTLDDKIELNLQMNETLEAMAQALFKSWFVDFDPVIDNALLAGNAIPEPLKERAELRHAQLDSGKAHTDSEINELFPSEFEFTEELGWIPKGWEVLTLDDITTELRRGISPKYTEENGIRVVNQRCIRNHTIDFAVCRLNDPSLRKVEGRLLDIGDVLVNSTGVGTLGRMAQVYELEEDTVVDSHVTVVRPDNSKVEKYYFGRLMLSIESIVESMGQGSTGQTELSRKHLGELSVCLPPSKIQKFVEDIFFSYAEKVNFNLGQSDTLAKIRDTLLPKLMSGELRIADAEKLVADI